MAHDIAINMTMAQDITCRLHTSILAVHLTLLYSYSLATTYFTLFIHDFNP